jgi:hypothetical protein
MTVGLRRTAFGATVGLCVCLLAVAAVERVGAQAAAPAAPAGQAAAPKPPLAAGSQMSETYFKNIQVLKGVPVDEFMDAMGMFSSSLGYDCVSCHDPGLYNDRAAFAIATPLVTRARTMIVMMNALNRMYFGGQQRVTCFTCHRGQNAPSNIPSLAIQYGELVDDPNSMKIFPSRSGSADMMFTKWIQAAGGAQRLAALKSWTAKGTYTGFNTGGSGIPIDIYYQAPDKRAQVVHMSTGDATKVYDGRNAWAAEGWRPMPLLPFNGGNLIGARLEAVLGFPPSIQKEFKQWTLSSTTIDDKDVQLVQGMNPGELPINLYFDDSGLLVRAVRWNQTAVGIVPVQFEFGNYKDVAGVKMPFHIVLTWTDGQNTFELSDIQANVNIPATRFNQPAPYVAKAAAK